MNSADHTRVLFVGRTTLDALYRLDAMPAEDTKAYATAMHAASGGPATNAALTHALLGGDATLVSPLGIGPWSTPVHDELARCGVRHIDLAANTAYETPLVTVLVNTSRSTRTAINPPLSDISFAALPAAWNPAWGPAPRVVLSDGFHLDATLGLLRACRDAGAALVLDGGSWKRGTDALAPMLTAAICSERFAVPGVAHEPEATLAWFATQRVPFAAITRGPKSILVLDRGRRYEIEIEAICAIDTLGAGDVLHGAFCYFLARTGDCEQALREAARVATQSCSGLGIDAWKR
ncbi:MAG: PfkB family carbohydrate kinase [Terracidiphilus sp.]|nr:PfkB family carbohydrate kinase [Terracidiphilus sp.]